MLSSAKELLDLLLKKVTGELYQPCRSVALWFSEFEDQIKIGVLQLGVPSGYLLFFGRMVASVLVQVLAEFCGGY